MSASCLFGIVIFNTQSSVVYRFLSDALYEHIIQGLKKRGGSYEENPAENEQVRIRAVVLSMYLTFSRRSEKSRERQ